jgi:hypothetical protein
MTLYMKYMQEVGERERAHVQIWILEQMGEAIVLSKREAGAEERVDEEAEYNIKSGG